ncbi:unnamed protein product [Orchesella dallaii]|uniref:Uncharacterized protein n=1 Tax=Orchesella dallaii TaxID=48710 RepID=A0ABP1RK92_9HEXA
MIRSDEAEPLYDWDREFENIYGVDELDPFNPLCKEPSEPSPDDDDPSEPTHLEEFDLDPGIYPRLKGSQEDVHEPGYRSGYVEDSSRCMVTAHDASTNQLSKPDTGREFFSSGGNSEMTTMPIDSKPKEDDLNG